MESASTLRQQTITQMDFCRPIYHPDSDAGHLLASDQEPDDVYHDVDRGPKRRKLDREGPPLHRPTRSEKESTGENMPVAMYTGIDRSNPPEGKEIEKDIVEEDRFRMPPPNTTPKTVRRREIPSSQSPADTPLSTRSRLRDVSRSPLKERSTNMTPQRASKRKRIVWAQGEIGDSLETVDEDSPISKRWNSKSVPLRWDAKSNDTSAENSPRKSLGVTLEESIGNDIPESMLEIERSGFHDTAGTARNRLKTEVQDSDEDEDDPIDDDFDAGLETQTAFTSSFEISQSAHPTSGSAEKSVSPSQSQRCLAKGTQVQSPQNPKAPHRLPSPSQNPASPSENRPTTPLLRRTDSEEVSLKLLSNDLQHTTQLPTDPEQDSQLQTTWDSNIAPLQGTSHPPSPQTHNSPHPLPSTPPSHNLPTPTTHPPFNNNHNPVPPSQATTVSGTQTQTQPPTSPPKSPTDPSNHKSSSPSPHPHCSLPSSPPPPPAPFCASSSPLVSRRETQMQMQTLTQGSGIGGGEVNGEVNGGAGVWYEWEGGLTDSQLLPASLMEESLVRPPRAWWGSEEEEGG